MTEYLKVARIVIKLNHFEEIVQKEERMPIELKSPQVEEIHQVIDCFWETFPPTWSTIREHIRSVAIEHFDISVEQFHILRNIRKGHTSISEIATAKHISRPAVSQAVNILVAKGLVVRQAGATDRRCVRLDLTEEGIHLLDSIFQKNREWMVEKMSSLKLDELQNISFALEQLRRAFINPKD